MTTAIKLPNKSKGKRPTFFDDPAVDHLMSMVLELSAELSVVYARVDTLERVLEESKLVDRQRLESYEPPQSVETERGEWRKLFLERLFRTLQDTRRE
jgi:hypothetical protein